MTLMRQDQKKTKKVTVANFRETTGGGSAATTAGTSVEITSSIPSWATEIKVIVNNVSSNAAAGIYIQLGDSGGLKTSGYDAHVSYLSAGGSSEYNTGDGFYASIAAVASASHSVMGVFRLVRWSTGNNHWLADGQFSTNPSDFHILSVGNVNLSNALTTINILTTAGTFDLGVAQVRYR